MRNFIILFFLFSGVILSQRLMDFDYARFYADDTSGYLEIYYTFYTQEMGIRSSEGGDFADGELGVQITEKFSNAEVYKNNWEFSITSEPENGNKSQTGLLRFSLKPSVYKIELVARDKNGKAKEEKEKFEVQFNRLPEEVFYMSDIEIASAIKMNSNDRESIFYKNSLEVIPQSSLVFGKESPVMFYYTELYNTLRNSQGKPLVFEEKFYNSLEEVVYKKEKKVNPSELPKVEIGVINLKKFVSGSYNLVLSLSNGAGTTVMQGKKVFIYNPDMIDSTSFKSIDKGVLASAFAVLNDDELQDIFKKSEYLATMQEAKNWEKLSDIETKREFLFEFWKERRNVFTDGKIVSMDSYFKRVELADKQFSSISRPDGWKTDRGRVFIVYGKPDEVKKYHNRLETKPYEVWIYNNLEGGVLFLFSDLYGFSEFKLIHSTKTGEIHDEASYEATVRN